MDYAQIIAAFNARQAVEVRTDKPPGSWREGYLERVSWSQVNPRYPGVLSVEVIVLDACGNSPIRVVLVGSELEFRLRPKSAPDEELAKLREAAAESEKRFHALTQLYNESQNKLWNSEKARLDWQAAAEKARDLADKHEAAVVRLTAEHEAAVKAVEILKKEVACKADALAEMPLHLITNDVICRHLAALRRLT